MRLIGAFAAFGVALFGLSANLTADVVPLGYLSYDTLIPGAPGSPGVNAFTVGNLTGDPALGGNAVPPAFPALTPLVFKNSTLVLTSGGSSQTLSLGDIGPGFFSSSDLEFPDTAPFASALFTATLDRAVFQLEGGGLFTADSADNAAQLLPSGGSSLVAGTDAVVITASGQVSAVPEPTNILLLITMLVLVAAGTRGRLCRKAEDPTGSR